MEVKPWIYGPLEVFVHGIEHYFLGFDKDLRFALIHCDNAVELALKSYIRFHNPQIYKKVRKNWGEISHNFERLMDVVRNHMPSFPKELGGELSYHHMTRNDLYHEARTLPRRRDVSSSIRSVLKLFKVLFGNDFDLAVEAKLYDSCILAFIELEFLFQKVCKKKRVKINGKRAASQIIDSLVSKGALSEETSSRIKDLARSREQIIRDMGRTIPEDTFYNVLLTVDEIINELQKI